MSLTDALQSLRCLSLVAGVLLPGHYWHANGRFAEEEKWALSKAWKLSDGVGRRPWSELSRDVRDQVIREEGLMLSEVDEVSVWM